MTWFLACLFSCEVMALFALRAVTSRAGQLLLGLAALVIGVSFCTHAAAPSAGVAHAVARFWFFGEAIVALGFYAIGHASRALVERASKHRALAAAAFVGFSSLVLATFRRNPAAGDVVMMSAERHGDVLPFVVTALAGTGAVIAIGILLARTGWLRWVGRSSLVLLGLNGVFFHYVNAKLAHAWHTPESQLFVLGRSLVATVLSLLICVPAVHLLNRYFPRGVGQGPRPRPRPTALAPPAAA